jgi:hypothetical protein
MFNHQTILLLRSALPEHAAPLPLQGYFRDYRFVRNVMEVKQHLLRCLQNMRPISTMPDLIVVDADTNKHDIKSELERWMESHPRLRHIKIIFSPPRSWIFRLWTRVNHFGSRCVVFRLLPAAKV